jgi:hypothetical protein
MDTVINIPAIAEEYGKEIGKRGKKIKGNKRQEKEIQRL